MLRKRLFLGVAPLIILLILVGGYAVWLFVRLGNAVNTTLHQNYVSIVAMRDIKDAALRIERILEVSRTGLDQPSANTSISTIEVEAAICRQNVNTELGIITEAGEREAAERLKTDNEAFLIASHTASERGKIDDGFRRSLDDLLKDTVVIQTINEHAMTEKDHRARETARQSTRVMLLAMVAALPSTLR